MLYDFGSRIVLTLKCLNYDSRVVNYYCMYKISHMSSYFKTFDRNPMVTLKHQMKNFSRRRQAQVVSCCVNGVPGYG